MAGIVENHARRLLLSECAKDEVGRQIRAFHPKLYLLRHLWTPVGLSPHWKPRNLVMGFGGACNRNPIQSTISEKGDFMEGCSQNVTGWTTKLCDKPDPGLGDRMDPRPGKQPEQSLPDSLHAPASSSETSHTNGEWALARSECTVITSWPHWLQEKVLGQKLLALVPPVTGSCLFLERGLLTCRPGSLSLPGCLPFPTRKRLRGAAARGLSS